MSKERKPDTKRGELAFMVAIVLGLLLGVFIKRIRVGLVIGIVLGLLIVSAGVLRSRSGNR
jgi:hypothetical protein